MMLPTTLWFDVALVCFVFALGNILLGHFEAGTPRLRRVLKFFFFLVLIPALSYFLGRWVGLSLLGLILLGAVYLHAVVLPRKGINGWTGEPKDKYYALRGWKQEP